MAILFENIDNGDTYSISKESDGKYYRDKIDALVNSSDLGLNHDRGQDFGIRLDVEQKAIIEKWEEDPKMVAEVSEHTHVPVDDLRESNFLDYLLYTQELGQNEDRITRKDREDKQNAYRERVKAAKASKKDK
jgi:hypothetical protein